MGTDRSRLGTSTLWVLRGRRDRSKDVEILVLRHQLAVLRRQIASGSGLAIAFGSVVVYAGSWLGISLLLPHGDTEWPALLPGAALVGVGVLLLHLVTVYYVSGKVGSASSLYGPLGAATAILGWTYLLGRLTVSSAVLNASLHHSHNG